MAHFLFLVALDQAQKLDGGKAWEEGKKCNLSAGESSIILGYNSSISNMNSASSLWKLYPSNHYHTQD